MRSFTGFLRKEEAFANAFPTILYFTSDNKSPKLFGVTLRIFS